MLGLIVLVLAGCQKEPEDTGDDLLWDPKFDTVAEALQADRALYEVPAVTMAIWEDGEIVFAAAYGLRHPDGDEPVDTETLFQIGSITKQMTALTVLQKVEDGLLSLDDTLAQTVPELTFERNPAWSGQVTLHDQLAHQTGMYDVVPWHEDDPADAALQSYTTSTFAHDEFLMNPPGAFWNYSNPNFVLAGLAVENVDERAWPDVLEQDVFAPLGMERSFGRKAPVEADGNVAIGRGYTPTANGGYRFGVVDMEEVTDFAWIRPAGLVWSTPSDLLLWADFVMHGDPDVVSDALRAEITTAHVPTRTGPTGADPAYGYGMFVQSGFSVRTLETYYDEPLWSHGGNTLSFTAGLYMLPERDYAIAYMASGYNVSLNESVARAVEAVGLGDPRPEPPEYTFDPDRLDDHVGSFIDPHEIGEMTVTRVGDALHVDLPGLAATLYEQELEPISDTIFLLTINAFPYDITFVGEPGSPSQYAVNRAFVLEREAPTSRRAPIAVTPSLDPPLALHEGPFLP